MSTIRITSCLGIEYRDELEKLLFFNPGQERVRSRISAAVEQFGMPAIRESGNQLRIEVDALGECQTLYAMDAGESGEELVGVVVFFRVPEDTVLLLHIAIEEEYAAGGERAGEQLSLRLVRTLESVASRLRGVHRVAFQYASRVAPGKAEAAASGAARPLSERVASRAAVRAAARATRNT